MNSTKIKVNWGKFSLQLSFIGLKSLKNKIYIYGKKD